MRLFKILDGVEHELIQGGDVEVKELTIDSRTVRQGSMFFCIEGFSVDGHKFIDETVSKGAAAVMVEKDVPLPENVAVIKVKNTRAALAIAAANFFGRPSESFDLYGVTGTNGKTSTTYFLEHIFNEFGKKTGLIGTIDIRVNKKALEQHFAAGTTPDVIELQGVFAAMRDASVQAVAMEVSSHGLAMNRVDGIRYKTAVFTNLTQDHLDLHGTMEEYKKAKGKLFENCDCAVINLDDAASEYFIKKAQENGCVLITYGINKPADLQALDVELNRDGVSFRIILKGVSEKVTVPIGGRFTVYNALGAIGAALSAGVPFEVIKKALREMPGVPGRMQSVPNGLGINIIVDYSHTPDSLYNIVTAAREFTKGKIITVFGCGGDRDRAKRPLMGAIAGENSDYCIITSDNPRSEEPESIMDDIEPATKKTGCPYERFADRREGIYRAVALAKPGDSVVIAGKGHENYQIFPDKTIHFDDCEVAGEAAEALLG